MVRVLLLASVLVAGLAGCSAPQPFVAQDPEPADRLVPTTFLDTQVLVVPGDGRFDVAMPTGAVLAFLEVQPARGAATSIRIAGFGGCDGFAPVAGDVPAVFVEPGEPYIADCGAFPPGNHALHVVTDGAFLGRIRITGFA